MVRLAFVGHNNKGRQRTYIAGSHYLDMIIINAHLHSHSEHIIPLILTRRVHCQ
jgi:hypothetical protein